MCLVLIKIVNFSISLEKETSLAAVRIKSRTRELVNISVLNVVECSMIEQVLYLIIFAKVNSLITKGKWTFNRIVKL